MYSAKELAIARLIKPDIEVAQLDVTDLAILQLVRKATGGGSGVYNANIENGIATFGGVVASSPLVSLLLNIPITQTGSGTPSPTNIRDFVGFSQAVIGQTSEYGEYFRGLLNGTYGFVDLGSLNWKLTSGSIIFYTTSDPFGSGSAKYLGEGICPNYERGYIPVQNPESGKWQIANSGDLTVLRIADSNYNDPVAFKTAMQGVYLIYEKKEPSTPITPQDFATLCQAFGITGNIYQISFGQTVYSAILDVVNGKLSVTHIRKAMSDFSWQIVPDSTSGLGFNYFRIADNIEDMKSLVQLACDCLVNNMHSRGDLRDNEIGRYNSSSYSRRLVCRVGSITTIEDWNTFIADKYIVYELAEPIEIQLTPTVINTLIGENVIFADVANVTECKYTRK